MAKILEMPKLSPTMEEGQLSTWHKKEGDVIAIDDLLAEVETDKATMEFRSFDKGTLLKLLVPAGSMVKLGQPVAIVGQPGEDISGLVGGAGGGQGGQPQGDQPGNPPAAEQQAPQGGQPQGNQGGQQNGDQQPAPPAQPPAGAASQSGTSGGYGGITPPGAGQQSGGSGQPSGKSGQQGQAGPQGQQGNQGGQPNGDQQGQPNSGRQGNQQGPQNQGPQAQGGQQAQGNQQGPQASAQQGGQGSQGQQGGQGQQPSGSSGQSASPSGGAERVKASPYVRKLAREHDVDLHNVQGSGPAGRVVARDVEPLLDGGAKPAQGQQGGQQDPQAQGQQGRNQQGGEQAAPQAEAAPKAAPKPAASGLAEPEARPLSMMRKTIARRLTEAKQTVPHFYLTIDVDAGALVELREKVNGELAQGTKKGEEAPKVSLNDFLIKACAAALRRVPECNAQFTPDAILVHRRVDISVAVAVPDGLVTPVLRDADRLGVAAISSAVRDLATRAKAKKLAPDEMQNGTFSISNLGMFGIDEFSAVINPPEGAILAVGRVRDEPVVRDGQVVAGKRLALTLSCDHRVIDGAVGARFLDALRSLIERPMQILVA